MTFWDKLIDGFQKQEPEKPFLYVHNGRYGIETYVNVNIDGFPQAYKKQIISFLEGVIKQLEND